MIDADWIRTGIEWAAQAEHGTIPRLTLIEFRELLALAARTVETEAQRDEMISLVCEHSNSKSFVCVYCVQERQKTIMEDRDRLAKALEIIQYEAECGVACEDEREVPWYVKRCRIILAAIATAKGDQQ